MAPIIVHVGFPKSASTLLQKGVFPAFDEIEFQPQRKDSEIYRALGFIDYPDGEARRLDVISAFVEKARLSKRSTVLNAEHFVMPVAG